MYITFSITVVPVPSTSTIHTILQSEQLGIYQYFSLQHNLLSTS